MGQALLDYWTRRAERSSNLERVPVVGQTFQTVHEHFVVSGLHIRLRQEVPLGVNQHRAQVVRTVGTSREVDAVLRR